MSPPPIRCSVIIRSYNRIPSLCELIEAVLRQTVQDFEIVVVEQTQRIDPRDAARLAALAADPRVRVLHHRPLGGPRARNVGARAARAPILVFMDDDDLPGHDRWLEAHLANFVEPGCLGVTGRHYLAGGIDPPYRNMARARRQVLSFVPVLMWQRAYTRTDRRRHVASIQGGNVSIRRDVLARVGLWDECTPIEDELSFCYRLRRAMGPDEFLVFDPEALMHRRMDVAGGMDKRAMRPTKLAGRGFEFLHCIVAHYFPVRFIVLYPAYVALLFAVTCDWVWNEFFTRGHLVRRVFTIGGLALVWPALWTYWLGRLAWRRVTRGPFAHAPRLDDVDDGAAPDR